jgi:hypothetical protein
MNCLLGIPLFLGWTFFDTCTNKKGIVGTQPLIYLVAQVRFELVTYRL